MSQKLPITPAELDWTEDALNSGASTVQLAKWQAERFEKPRTVPGIRRITRAYGLRPGHVATDFQAAHNLAAWGELKDQGVMWVERYDSPGRIWAMRWLVRHGAAHLYGYEPGEGVGHKAYRKPRSIYINKEYKPWTPWSN